jgi:hypothetical protein
MPFACCHSFQALTHFPQTDALISELHCCKNKNIIDKEVRECEMCV